MSSEAIFFVTKCNEVSYAYSKHARTLTQLQVFIIDLLSFSAQSFVIITCFRTVNTTNKKKYSRNLLFSCCMFASGVYPTPNTILTDLENTIKFWKWHRTTAFTLKNIYRYMNSTSLKLFEQRRIHMRRSPSPKT